MMDDGRRRQENNNNFIVLFMKQKRERKKCAQLYVCFASYSSSLGAQEFLFWKALQESTRVVLPRTFLTRGFCNAPKLKTLVSDRKK